MKMTLNKLIATLLIVLTLVLVPLTSSSKESGNKAIVLSEKNLLVLNGEVNGNSVGKLISQAKELDAKLAAGKPLYLYLNSPGGSVMSGLQLIEALQGLGRPIHTVTAFAASMAFQIAQNMDDRLILQSGILMSHRAAGSFGGSFGGTSPSQLDQRIHLFVQMVKELDEQTVSRTSGKQTLDSYTKAYQNELWLTGQESIAGGYADKIVKVKCDKSLTGTSQQETNVLGFPVMFELDKCPINASPINAHVGNVPGMTPAIAAHVKEAFLAGYDTTNNTPKPMDF